MLEGLTQLNAKLDRLAHDFGKIGERVAKDSVGDVGDAVRGSIGDTSMSGWMRGNPVEIVGRAVKVSEGYAVEPAGKAKGPMRVLQSGRNAYAAGDRRNSGTYTSKKTGEIRQKTRKVKRATGAHGGKGTWDQAERLIQTNLPARASKALHEIMAKTFRGG
jgi:hypothetical protein